MTRYTCKHVNNLGKLAILSIRNIVKTCKYFDGEIVIGWSIHVYSLLRNFCLLVVACGCAAPFGILVLLHGIFLCLTTVLIGVC